MRKSFRLAADIFAPAVQTLGHLGQMLQWSRFGSMRDTHEVLLARSEEVYTFIEKVRNWVTSTPQVADYTSLARPRPDDPISDGFFKDQEDSHRHGRSARCQRRSIPPDSWLSRQHSSGKSRNPRPVNPRKLTLLRQFTDHLRRVNDICKRVGVEPMIWSDSALRARSVRHREAS